MFVAGVTYLQDSFKKRLHQQHKLFGREKVTKKKSNNYGHTTTGIIYLFLIGVGSNNSVPFRSQLITL